MNKKVIITIFLSFIVGTSSMAFSFEPNYILSDEEMTNSDSMTLLEIEEFLKSQDGYISKNMFENADGKVKSAAQIIYDAAHNYDCSDADMKTNFLSEKELKCKKVNINPKLLLVLLQKEQGLLTEKSPTERQLNYANGYGCPDGGGCNDRWKGFGKQVNSASLQFWDYMDNPQHYKYKAGETYTLTNSGNPDSVVTPKTQATAALYNYTPHVYYGNYNFYKLWIKFFTKNYPNGSLLQAEGEPGVWLIQNGKKRPFTTKGALTSRYDLKKIITVTKSDLDKYPKGAPIKFPQYSLIMSPKGSIYLIVDNKKRPFLNYEAFRSIGYNPDEIIKSSWEDVNAYEDGQFLTATSSYPTGALLQDKTTGGVYWVTEGTKAPLWSAVLLKTKYRGKSITPVEPEKLASYKTVEPAIFGNGELITSDERPAVYVVEDGKKRPFLTGEVFEELGYKWENIISVPQKIVDLYEDGEMLTNEFAEIEEDFITDDSLASTTDESLASTTEAVASTTTDEVASTTNTTIENPDLQDEINDILNPLN